MIWHTLASLVDLGRKGRDPDSIKAHTLNIIQIVGNPTPVSATIGPVRRIAGRIRAISKSEAVRDDLDRSRGE